MSDIWHTANEIPDFNKSYVELSRSVQGDLVYSTWGHPNYITKNTIKWCYMDDLLALETELERTRKALEKAKSVLTNLHDYARLDGFQERDVEEVLSEIKTALEQKDVK